VKRVLPVKFGFRHSGVAAGRPLVGRINNDHVNTEVSLERRCNAPASTTRTTVAQESCIAIECITLTALKMLHWLAGAKQPDGSGRDAPSGRTVAFID
jgi:hypothetical protein